MKTEVKFYRVKKKGRYYIYACVSYDKQRILHRSTCLKMENAREWDNRRKQFTVYSPEQMKNNRVLLDLSIKVSDEIEAVCMRPYTLELLEAKASKVFNQVLGNREGRKSMLVENGQNYAEYLDAFIKGNPRNYKQGTMKKYVTIRNKIGQYHEETGNIISFYSSDPEKDISAFRQWMYDRFGMTDSSMHKYASTIKYVWDMAAKEGIHQSGALSIGMKRPPSSGDVLWLYEEELRQIMDFEPPSLRLKNIKDILLIGCFTGQRISDLMNFRFAEIETRTLSTESGLKAKRFVWKVFQIKGDRTEPVYVPLHNKAMHIIHRLWEGKEPSDFVLPRYSEQKINNYFKELCRLAGLSRVFTKVRYSNKNRVEERVDVADAVSTHTCRRTFANIALNKGVPEIMVRSITGHKTANAFYDYVGKSPMNSSFDAMDAAFGIV